MSAIFISDLHLDEEKPDITQAFLQFLTDHAVGQQSLFILGDLFEVWIGDDYSNGLIDTVKKALSEISGQGTKLFFQHGNRDFLLGDTFCEEVGGQIIPESHIISPFGSPILLMHGDLLCTDDVDYLAARKILRDDNFIADFLTKSIEERQMFAQQLRQQSKDAGANKSYEIMDVNEETVHAYMQEHAVANLIHGHTHRPNVHDLVVGDNQAKRYVLSDWDNDINYIKLDESGIEFLTYDKH